MNQEEIEKILPHREDMLLLDDVETDGETAVGHYRVRGDEFFLRGHFPEKPVVPGVILRRNSGAIRVRAHAGSDADGDAARLHRIKSRDVSQVRLARRPDRDKLPPNALRYLVWISQKEKRRWETRCASPRNFRSR